MGEQRNQNWTESEVRAAIRAYFKLLEQDLAGTPTNKAQVYRDLEATVRSRSAKAFEWKFANISAVLLEERRPFVRGLLPRHNYQALLKALVLRHLEREPLPVLEPYQELFRQLSALKSRGFLPVTGAGSGRFGTSLEAALGIDANSSKAPDFMGIELKTHAGGGGRQTLFALAPEEYPTANTVHAMFESHHRVVLGVERLAGSVAAQPGPHGFRLRPAGQVIEVLRHNEVQMRWRTDSIEQALLRKHGQAAYIELKTAKKDGADFFRVTEASYHRYPSILRLLDLMRQGKVSVDLTLKRVGGRLTNHGFLWRIDRRAIAHAYHHSASMSLGEQVAA